MEGVPFTAGFDIDEKSADSDLSASKGDYDRNFLPDVLQRRDDPVQPSDATDGEGRDADQRDVQGQAPPDDVTTEPEATTETPANAGFCFWDPVRAALTARGLKKSGPLRWVSEGGKNVGEDWREVVMDSDTQRVIYSGQRDTKRLGSFEGVLAELDSPVAPKADKALLIPRCESNGGVRIEGQPILPGRSLRRQLRIHRRQARRCQGAVARQVGSPIERHRPGNAERRHDGRGWLHRVWRAQVQRLRASDGRGLRGFGEALPIVVLRGRAALPRHRAGGHGHRGRRCRGARSLDGG